VSPYDERQTIVLGTPDEWVDAGRLCFVVLNADMPRGKYRIRLTRQHPERAYVILSRTTPGAAADESIRIEDR
jgi:hypothetical protein